MSRNVLEISLHMIFKTFTVILASDHASPPDNFQLNVILADSRRRHQRVPKSRKKRNRDPFAVVQGKVVERIEVSTMSDDCAIGILFEDRTYLGFDLDPFLRITPDFSDWKTHNYKSLKRWPPLRSEEQFLQH